MNKKLRKAIKATSIVLLVLIIGYFLFRNAILSAVIDKKINAYQERYNCEIGIEDPELTGILTFNSSKVWIKKNNAADTLLRIKDMKASLGFFKLLIGKIKIKEISASSFALHVFKNDSLNNVPNFVSSDKRKISTDTLKISKKKPANYSGLVARLFNTLFTAFPSQVDIKDIVLNYSIDKAQSVVVIPSFNVNDGDFGCTIYGFENKLTSALRCIGNIDHSDEKLFVNLSPLGKNYERKIPFLGTGFGLQLGSDTLSFAINKTNFSSDFSSVSGYATAINLQINHPRISPEDVVIKKGVFNFTLNFFPNKIELDSLSNGLLNKLYLKTYFSFDNANSKKYELKFGFKETPAQDFFESLPSGLFQNFEGIKTKGNLSYRLHFAVDMANPDSVVFDSKMTKSNFKITGFGKTNFAKLNGEFMYTAYEKGFAMKTFPVGNSYVYYTAIDNINAYLKSALMTSEDGSFYYHSGFNEGAFKQSIATNIKEKRFARGGSTISMQLVKNVFLTRNKTVARKIEEALIVWLIESNRLVSKERMYEVYLNIIEWGPGVYGIGHASQFYFSKTPSSLTLEESIFLASIVPRPKAFKYSFDESGNLKPHLEGYYKLLGNHLWAKGIISEEQKNNLQPKVELTGIAKSFVVKPDTLDVTNPVESEELDY